MTSEVSKDPVGAEADEDRRNFLAACGRFAVVTPPAIALLLSTSVDASAKYSNRHRSH